MSATETRGRQTAAGDRALRWVFALVATTNGASQALTQRYSDVATTPGLLSVAALAVLALLVVDVIRRGATATNLGVGLVLYVCVLVLNGPSAMVSDIDSIVSSAVICLAAITCRVVVLLHVVVFIVGARMIDMAAESGLDGLDRAVDDALLTIGFSMCLVCLFAGLMTAMRQADLAEQAARRADGTLGSTRRREMGARQVERLVHDDVIGTLTVVDRLGVLEPEGVRAAARRALSALEGVSADRAAAEPLEWSLPGLPRLTVTVDPRVDLEAWPAHVVDGMSAAVAEALRNVQRHAGVDHAAVHVGVAGDVLEMRVVDRGRGMAKDASEGVGLGSSIRGRMVDLGGSAHVSSSPRRGTTVILRWSRQPRRRDRLHDAFRQTDVAVGGVGRLTLVPVSFFLAGNVLLALRYLPGGAHLVLESAVLAGLVVLTVVSAVRCARRPVTVLGVVGIVAAANVLLGAGLYAAGPGALLDYESWVVECSMAPVFLLAVVVPVRVVVPVAATMSALVTAAAVVDPTLTIWDALIPISIPPVQLGVLMLVMRRIRRLAIATDHSAAEVVAAVVSISRDRDAIDDVGERLMVVRSTVAPFLERVASGAAPLDSEEVQGEARSLAVTMRDELVAGPLLDEAVRSALQEARDRGVDVTFRRGRAETSRGPLRRLLVGLLPVVDDDGVVVVAEATAAVRPNVVVRPAVGAASVGPLLDGQWRVEHEPLATRFVLAEEPGD